MLPDLDVKNIASQRKWLSEEALTAAAAKARKEHTTLEELLLADKTVTEDDLYRSAAEFYRLPFASLKEDVVSQDFVQRIPESIADKYRMIIRRATPEYVEIATSLPPDPTIAEFLERKLGLPIHLVFATRADLDTMLRSYRIDVEQEIEKIDTSAEATRHIDVVELIHGLIENAVKMNASDIHIEPRERRTAVRYRVDGELREVTTLPAEIHNGVVSHIKILSNIKLEEHRQPQDGRFNMSGPGYKVSIRVSTIPLLEKEKVVMRILHQDQQFQGLTELGLSDRLIALVGKTMTKRHGMILVTGPTGSGKTTTLYTILKKIDRPEINISTIEDPIEYNFDQINQSQVNMAVNYSFDAGLRGFLRQDPDVIMVGEIRDVETASIALRAALTGHMVLSTLHTNDAATTLTRLLEMGMQNFLIASTINLVIAQRLVKQICSNCRRPYPLSPKMRLAMEAALRFDLKEFMKKHELPTDKLVVYKGNGCDKCGGTGYKGRIGIFELMAMSPGIYAAIIENASSNALEEVSRKEGMITLVEDGVLKVLEGRTTFEELILAI